MKKFCFIVMVMVIFVLSSCGQSKEESLTTNPELSETKQDIETKSDSEETTNQTADEVLNKVYSNEELVELARKYYVKHKNYEPSDIEVDSEDGDMVTIHLYDYIEDEADGMGHTATADWYYVDRKTGKGTNFVDEEIDLSEVDE